MVGVLFACLAAISFSGLDVFVKESAGLLTVWQIAMGRSVWGLIVVLVLTRAHRLPLWGEDRLQLFYASLAGVGTFVFLNLALRSLPLALALVLLYTFPAFAALLTPLIADEKIPRREWPLMGLAFIGLLIILWPTEGLTLSWGHLYGLAGGFSMGLALTILRGLRAQKNALTPHLYYCLSGIVICSWPLIAQPEQILPETSLSWWLLLLGSTLALIGNLCTNKALQTLSSPKTGVILMGEVLVGAVAGVMVFNEPLTWRLTVGAIGIVLAGAFLVLGKQKG